MGANMREVGQKYFTAQMVEDGPIQLVIKKVELDVEMGATKEKNPVLWFENAKLGMVLGAKTNRLALCDAFGDNSDDWIGKTVELYAVETTFSGKPCRGLRVRVPK